MITFLVDLPPGCLSPNSRAHWGKKHRARAKYKADCAGHAQKAKSEHRGEGLPWKAATAVVQWHIKNLDQHPDMDNAIASLKAAIDGLEEILIVNDRDLRIVPADPFFVESKRTGVQIQLVRSEG